jgi:biopolymer transport protein TolR
MAKLSPQQRAYVRKRTKAGEPDPSEDMGELNIVPFLDIVVNILLFLLATVQAVLVVAEIDAQLPSLGRRVGRTQLEDAGSTLNLSVTVTRNGIIVSGSGGKLAPGCTEMQSGRVITVPAQGGRLLWTVDAQGQPWGENSTGRPQQGPTARLLTQCARRIHDQFPDENKVIISADPEVEFQHLVGTMDALRADGSEELFTEVLLSAGVR